MRSSASPPTALSAIPARAQQQQIAPPRRCAHYRRHPRAPALFSYQWASPCTTYDSPMGSARYTLPWLMDGVNTCGQGPAFARVPKRHRRLSATEKPPKGDEDRQTTTDVRSSNVMVHSQIVHVTISLDDQLQSEGVIPQCFSRNSSISIAA